MRKKDKKELRRNGVRMRNGMVMHGWMTNGAMTGLVLLMTGLVIGLGPKMTGAIGAMTGLGVLRTGGAEQPSASALSGTAGTATVPQDSAKNEPSPSGAAVTVEAQDRNAPRSSRTVRNAKPGLMTNLFVGVRVLTGALSAGCHR